MARIIGRLEINLAHTISSPSRNDRRPRLRRISNTPKIAKKKPAQSGKDEDSKCDQKKPTSSVKDDGCGEIIVGIVGGGMASVYAAVLLKQSRLVNRVHLLDPKDSSYGMILDASHIDTSAKLKYFKKSQAKEALKDVSIVALMDEDDFAACDVGCADRFRITSNYVRSTTDKMVRYCPTALAAIFARPVTATLPMITEMYKCAGWWDPDRIIGSTALECMRVESITASLSDLNPAFLSVPMVGGADPCTVVPIFSRARPSNHFTRKQVSDLIGSLRAADQDIARTESKVACLSRGTAACKFIQVLAAGLAGLENAAACAYVRSNVLPGCRYFTSELQFGPGGVLRNLGVPKVSPIEVSLIERAIPCINRQVEIAIDAVRRERMAN